MEDNGNRRKAAHRESTKRWMLANKDKVRNIKRTWKKKNPEKERAHRILYRAVKFRGMQRGVCEVCGDQKTEGHHEDYSKPFEVRWLCSKHHRSLHRNQGISLPKQSGTTGEEWGGMKFDAGDKVQWVSQSRGYRAFKRGTIIEVLEPSASINHYKGKYRASHNTISIRLARGSRPEESYLVEVKKGGDRAKLYVYWPLVMHLKPDTTG